MDIYNGQIVGSLLVRFPVTKKGATRWRARCRGCLSEHTLTPSDLKSGTCPSCRRARA